MVNRIAVAIVIGLCLSLLPYHVDAATLQNKGLFVSPSRQDIKVAAGSESAGKMTVYNYYTKSLHVDLAVKEFSASGETYKYTFKQPIENWITLSTPKDGIELQKDESRTVSFAISVPKDATPGDHYFALFASADMSGKGFRQTAQVASLIYVQVDGGRIVRSAVVENADVPSVIFSTTAPYSFNVKNTGNVHFDAYFYARLESWFGKYPMVGANQVVLAKSTRKVSGAVPLPLLPGIYKMTYGYISDNSTPINTRSETIIYIPPWSIVVTIFTGLVVMWTIQRRKKQREV